MSTPPLIFQWTGEAMVPHGARWAKEADKRFVIGAGHGIDADLGLAHESAVKEAETDAMKRCLMTFGNPFGLALYDKTQANVAEAPPEQIGPSSAYTKHLEALYHVNTLEGLKTWRESVSADSDAISDAEWTDLSNQLFNRKKAISQKEPA